MLDSQVPSTHSPRPRRANRIDKKGNGLNFTLDEFQQVVGEFPREKVPPQGHSGWVERTREAEFLQLAR